MRVVLQIFAKAPVPGECKTRLMPALGAQGAAQLHERLVRHRLAMACEWQQAAQKTVQQPMKQAAQQSVQQAAQQATAPATQHTTPPMHASARVELWCAQDPQHAFFATCANEFNVTLQRQSGPTLGARMWIALCGALARGERPVLIGTDCPALNAVDITAAFAALDTADAVFAPAHDGGYVLAGLARAVPELFASIAWGSNRVMSATRKAAARTHTRLATLRTLHDLDTPADLARLERDPQLAGLLAGVVK